MNGAETPPRPAHSTGSMNDATTPPEAGVRPRASGRWNAVLTLRSKGFGMLLLVGLYAAFIAVYATGQKNRLLERFNELQEDANLRRNEEFGKVQRTLLQEVQTYARANSFDLIVSDGVLFAAPSVDVTAQVIAALRAKAPAAPAKN